MRPPSEQERSETCIRKCAKNAVKVGIVQSVLFLSTLQIVCLSQGQFLGAHFVAPAHPGVFYVRHASYFGKPFGGRDVSTPPPAGRPAEKHNLSVEPIAATPCRRPQQRRRAFTVLQLASGLAGLSFSFAQKWKYALGMRRARPKNREHACIALAGSGPVRPSIRHGDTLQISGHAVQTQDRFPLSFLRPQQGKIIC